jgi:hypothetical protein
VWITALCGIYHFDIVLPLDYFSTHLNGRLGDGNYATVISAAGSVVGAVVAWAVGQGFKHVIRVHEAGPTGISLSMLDTLSRLQASA